MNVFFFILTNNIAPIFALIILGFALSKKFALDIMTLTKLNFFVFVPAFTFVNLYTTQIPMEMVKVLIATSLILIANTILVGIVAKFRGYDQGLKNAFLNSVIFTNAGNIGIPLITLTFSRSPYLDVALTAQIMVMTVQIVTVSTLGFINAGRANTHWKKSIVKVFGMPTIYMIPLAFILKTIPYDFTNVAIWPALEYATAAVISVALLTLGVQLSKTKFELCNKEVYLSALMRLVVGPLIALLFIYGLRMEGVIAQVVLISSALPTAVNAALIAVECENCPDFSSQTVLISTLFGSISLVFVIYMAGILYPII